MAMGTRRRRQRQEELWYRRDLAEAPGHPFYRRLNEVLDQAGFDEFCEARCRQFYHEKLGRPSLAPGMYFRVMLIGFFEGIESERGIAWRVADSLCLRQFLQIGLDERTPDHVTISRTRRLMDEAAHQEVFGWVLRQVARTGLLKGRTIGIDATTLEANAAMKSIVRRDTEESYTEYLKRLAEAAGLEATDEAVLRRMDRRRKKKGSNEEWVNPYDPEAEITRLKDGRTALAYKAEHAVDLDTGAIVAVTTHGGAVGDTTSVGETLPAAGEAVAEQIAEPTGDGKFKVNAKGVEELVTDKGYHSGDVLVSAQQSEVRPYIAEPDRGPSRQAVAEAAGRTGRAHVRACLRDGCSAAIVRAWKAECAEEAAATSGGMQSGAAAQKDDGSGYATSTSRRGGTPISRSFAPYLGYPRDPRAFALVVGLHVAPDSASRSMCSTENSMPEIADLGTGC